ncbi:Ig-like domain-containing protein [Herbaspirillum sp. SJZ099]|uniref:Ig-like domain-containing protein n=1 Tax=Herbaspirillum sp. SJZ099 TaxID=2572916 RepID=UPI0011AE0FE0|nr:Ig-like domain-containing protein [Herbaspirillum sp. SJZ099]TWC71794.1 Ig-like domain-containing protein [Herbaspirillum sp. SJZ099]
MNDIRVPFRVLHAQSTPSSTASPRPLLRRASRLLSLEQRFMFDAAAVATAADAAHNNDTHDAAHAADTAAAHLVRAADPGANEGKKEVVFVDTSLANYQALEAGVRAGVAIVEFDGSADGLAQIAQWARGNTGYDAIHIFSHGSEGILNLGATVLNEAALASDSVKAGLADIGRALNDGGDLLLYGCDVAAGDDGQLLINDIARLTGADVAASTDITGAAGMGGNWTLESHVGEIDARALGIDSYDGVMGGATFVPSDVPGAPQSSVTKVIDGVSITFRGYAGNPSNKLAFTSDGTPIGGLYVTNASTFEIVAQAGYSFDLTSIMIAAPAGGRMAIFVTDTSGVERAITFITSDSGYATYTTLSRLDGSNPSLSTIANDVIRVRFAGDSFPGSSLVYQSISISDIRSFVKVTDNNISITSTGTGLNGAYKIGDTITAQWNSTSSGDNNSGIAAATFDFSQFGGSATVAGTNVNGIWTASYTITAGNIDMVNRNVSVQVTSNVGVSASATDSTNLTVDNIAPTVTAGQISISGATGAGGAYKIGDTVTVTWNDTASGDNNSDVISGVTVDFSQFGGSTVSATNAGGVWSASYTIAAGSIDALNRTASVTVMDDAGNTTTRASGAVQLDNIVPTVVITSSAGNLAAGETAIITFNFSEDPGASFTWNGSSGDLIVVGGTLSAIMGSGLTRTAVFTPTAGVNSGTATITVAAGSYADVVGNISGPGASISLTYDTLAPGAPSAPVMSGASDTGVSSSDGITRNTTPTFTGTAEAGARVTLYDTDGVTVLGSGVADGSGNWSITTSALGEGTHVLQAMAVDAAGNISPCSAGSVVVIDTTPPGVVISSNVSSLKAGETATITFTFSEDPGSTFTAGDIVVSGGTLSAITGSGLTRTAVFTPTAGVNNGTASITVAAGSYTDAAGNGGAAGGSPTLTFDTLAPNAPSAPVMSSASDTGVSNSDGITRTTTPTFTGTAEAGSTVTLYDTDGTTVLGTAVATGGTWSITVSALSEGTHTITARATDSAGNIGARSAGAVVVIDITPPGVVISSNVSSLKAGETATITFTFSEDPGSTFTAGDIAVSGGTLSAISGSGLTRTAVFTPTAGVNNGTASITVAAGSYTDAAGNGGAAGGSPTLTFDTLAPNAPSAPVMSSASDTGVSNSDGITSNTTPTFTGTAEAGSTVTLYDSDGVTVLGSTVAVGGTWTITTSVLGEGTHILRASAVDAAGNISPRSAGLVVVIDTMPPGVTISSNVSSLKAGETATITFTFSEDPGSSFDLGDVTVTGGTLSAISGTGLTRTAVFTPTAGVNNGTASITVAAGSYTDAAGNGGAAGAAPSLTFDTLAPNAPSAPVMNSASDTGVSNSDGITRNTTPTFTGTAEAGSTVTLYDTDGTTVLGTAVATGGTWSITVSTLSEGAHTITARATDSAGNIGARSAGAVVVIDITPPGVVISSNVSSLKSGETATITFTFSEDPGSTFTVGDIAVSGGTLSAISGSGLTRTATFTPTAGVNNGTASITVTAGSYTDVAGNGGGAGATPTLTFNTLVPAAQSAPVMDSASDTGISSSDGITRNTTPTFTGTAAAGATVTLYDTDGTTVLGVGVADGSGNWSITSTPLADGSHTLHATATDGSGNVSGLSAAAAITIDTTPPTVSISSNVSSLKSGETATITFTFSEDPGSTFTAGDIAVSGGTLSAISGSGLMRTATFTPTAGVNNGTASITVTAGSYTDVAGNGGGAGATPTLTFNTLVPAAPSAPVMDSASDTGISSSDGITSNTTPTFTGTAAAGTTVTLYDTDGTTVLGVGIADGSGNWSITSTPLAEGSHTLHATATDGSGNVSGLSAAAAITIDTTPPTLVITSNVSSLKIGETATITFTFSEDPGGTFALGDIITSGGTLSSFSGTGLIRTAIFTPTANTNGGTADIRVPVGRYTDMAGNSGGAGATPVLSFDTLAPNAPSAPVMSSASDTGVSNSDGITRTTTPTFTGTAEAGSTVTLYDTDGTTVLGTAVATGGTWSITVSTLSEGAHTITARATDAAGNIGARSAGLGVTIDTTPPTVSISSNIATLAVGTTATITFTFSEDPGSMFTAGDIAVSGGTLSAITGSGLTRTAIFTPTAGVSNGTASVAVTAGSYTDAAGNSGSGATSPLLSVHTLPPDAPSGLTLVGGTDNIINSATPTIMGSATPGTWVEVTLYDSNGITVLGTTATASGTWSITTSALSEGVHTIHALSTDAAGNTSSVSAGLTITIDTTPPSVVISSSASNLKSGETATITFTFSEDPGSSFDLGDVTVTGGTLSAISGSGLTRTAVFTPTDGVNSGTASITVAAGSYTDAAGNGGAAGATPSLTFDTLAPNAPSAPVMSSASDTGVSNSDGITRTTTPTFTGTAEAGSTVTLYDTDGTTVLGTAVATGGTWSITVSALGEGTHTITARATDSAGNIGARSAGAVVVIDTTPPGVTISSNVSTLKSGETATITFTFSEDPGSSFDLGDVTVTGGTLSAISGSGLTRTATFTPTAGVNNGTASITVVAGSYTDAAGNGGAAGAAPTLTFDTLAPNAPSKPAMSSASDTGISNSDGITSNTTPTFTGTAEAGATVILYDTDGITVLGSGVADGSGHWSITTSALGEGTHEIDALAIDSAGNVSGSSPALSVTIITTAPTQTVGDVNFSAPAGLLAGELVTSSTAHTISGTLSAALGAGQSVEVSLDNGNTWSRADAIIGDNTWRIDGILDAAGSTVKIRVSDVAGNSGATWSQAYTVDTTPPAVASVSVPSDGTYLLGQNLDFVVRFSEAVVVNTSGGIPSIALTLDTGGTVQAVYVSGSGTDSLLFRYTVSNDARDLTGVTVGALTTNGGQVKDIAGNDALLALNGLGSTAAVNVDGLDPHVVNVAVANGSGAYGAGSTITIVVTYDRPVAVDTFNGTPSFALNSGGVATYASGAGTSTLVFTYTVAPGENANGLDLGGALLLNGGVIVDAGGLQANAQLNLGGALNSHAGIVIDTIPPATPVIDRVDTSDPQPVFGGSAALGSGERLTVTVGGATYNVIVAANGSWSLDLASATPSIGSLSLISGGNYTVTVTAIDLAGNSSSASTTLQMSAATPPSVLRPVFSRALAFLSSPAFPLFMSRTDTGSGSEPALVASSFALPEWNRDFVEISSAEQEGTGVPADARLADPTVQSKLTVGGGFAVAVLAGRQPGDGLVVKQGIRDQVLAATSYTEFFVPTDAFAHADPRAAVYLSATQGDGKPLPYWVSFNPATGKFVVDAKACLTADVSVKVVAHDSHGKAVAAQFHIRVGEQGANANSGASTSGMSLEHAGCIALSEQIRLAAQPHRNEMVEQLAKLVATLPA